MFLIIVCTIEGQRRTGGEEGKACAENTRDNSLHDDDDDDDGGNNASDNNNDNDNDETTTIDRKG